MADLWQSYGSWILYALFFLVFLWLHGLMHGIGGAGRHGGHCGMDHGDEENRNRTVRSDEAAAKDHEEHTSDHSGPHHH